MSDFLPSRVRPWLEYYPESMKNIVVPDCTIAQFIDNHRHDIDEPAVEYYGNIFTYRHLMCLKRAVKRSLLKYGVRPDDQICVFMESSPVFLALLFACEEIGASIVCRDGMVAENMLAVYNAKAKLVFISDTFSEELATVLDAAHDITVVCVDARDYIKDMPVHSEFDYCVNRKSAVIGVPFRKFLSEGRSTKDVEFFFDFNRPLLRCYTTGTTGMSKQVVHSSHSILGVLCQMTGFASDDNVQRTWLQAVLPPSLVACVVSMQLMPLANDNVLILDPFCMPQDIGASIAAYEPNGIALIPMFADYILNSDYIKPDADWSFIRTIGVGAEAMTNARVKRLQEFLRQHGSSAEATLGYGLSEAGSNLTFVHPLMPSVDCCYGMPMPGVVMGIFDEDNHELGFNEVGYICVQTPGMMLSYGGLTYDKNDANTGKVLVRHDDGQLWLHTGDVGRISEVGAVYVYGRGMTRACDGTYLSPLLLENKWEGKISHVKDMFFTLIPRNGDYDSVIAVVPDEGFDMQKLREELYEHGSLFSDAEYPSYIICLKERPYWHFKTARNRLVDEILRQEAFGTGQCGCVVRKNDKSDSV